MKKVDMARALCVFLTVFCFVVVVARTLNRTFANLQQPVARPDPSRSLWPLG